MKYPDCPEGRTDCRFVDRGGFITEMYSPIEYDRDGNSVGGGRNKVTLAIDCNSCGKSWIAKGTELEQVQGKLTFVPVEKNK